MKTLFYYLVNLFYIFEGYAKWAFDEISGRASERSKKRLGICECCVHNINGICDCCGCIIKAKVRVDFPLDDNGKSIDGCPEKKW